MFCTKCGAQINEGQKFCTKCGTPVATQNPVPGTTPIQPTPDAERMQAVKPTQVVMPTTSVQTPVNVAAEVKKGQKKKNTALIVVACTVAALVLILLAVLAVKIFVLDKGGGGSSDDGWESSEDEREPFDDHKKEDHEEKPVVEDAESAVEEAVSARELLYQKNQELCEQLGDACGNAYDVRYQDDESCGSIGVLGGLIMDVSGDDVEDLIVVYAESNFTATYADVYTVENGEVVSKVMGLTLWEGTPIENGEGIACLKLTADGWNLIGDSASRAGRIVDGVEGRIIAYNCQDHSYSMVVNEYYAGSDLHDTEWQIYGYGRKAGLSVDEIQLGSPYVLEDRNVEVIAGYIQRIDQSIDWQTWYDRAHKGSLYGTLRIARLTTQECDPDQQAASNFLNDCSDTGDYYESAPDMDGDYILPESSSRKLTESDMELIEGNEYLLRLARNEIYARHGRKFDSEELRKYFMSKDWYEPLIEPNDFDEDMLTKIEKYNRDLIKKYEADLN